MKESKYHPYLVFLISIIAFLPALRFDLIHYDDVDLIYGQAHVLNDWKNIFHAFIAPLWPADHGNAPIYYRPINSAYLVLISSISGGALWVYYLSSILLHATVATLLFAVLSSFWAVGPVALITSLFFSLHPITAPVVGWTMGYADSLLALFSLGSLLSLIHLLKKGFRFTFSNLFSHFLLVFAAIASKENGLLLPVALFFFVPKSRRKDAVPLYALWLSAIVLYFILRDQSNATVTHSGMFDLSGWWATLSTVIPSLVMGIRKIIFPFFPLPQTMPTPHMIEFLIGLGSVAAIIGLIKKYRIQKEPVYFGFIWFFCFYFPSLYHPSITPYSETILREDRLYTASIGIYFISAFIFKHLLSNQKEIFKALLVLVLFLGLTQKHLQDYSDRYSFWSASVKGNDLAISRVHLADTYTDAGDFTKALELYDEALRLNPKERMVHNNRGVVFIRLKKYKEAEQAFLQEMGNEPYQALAMLNLATIKKLQNDDHAAQSLLKQLIEIHPRFIPAYQQLITLLIELKKPIEAKEIVQKLENQTGVKVPPEIMLLISSGKDQSHTQ